MSDLIDVDSIRSTYLFYVVLIKMASIKSIFQQ